jgi:outer membrane protein assembly factor BamD
MRAPQRDQAETKEAIKEFEAFVARYPNSDLMPEAKEKLREAHDRLSMSDYLVGYFYFRSRWYPGAIDRFQSVLKQNEAYNGRDAVYFYLGEALVKVKREAEALAYYERLLNEFDQSEHLDDARKRVAELKAQAQNKQPAPPR